MDEEILFVYLMINKYTLFTKYQSSAFLIQMKTPFPQLGKGVFVLQRGWEKCSRSNKGVYVIL